MGRQAFTRRRRHHERSLLRRHAPARHLHVLPDFRRRVGARLVGGDLPPHRRRRARSRLQRSRQHGDLPGGPAHPAAAAVPQRRHGRDARSDDRPQCPRAGPGDRRSPRAIRRLPGRRARDRPACRALWRRRNARLFRRLARLRRAHGARRDRDLAERHLPLHRSHRQRRPVRRSGAAHRRGDSARRRHAAGRLDRLVEARCAPRSTRRSPSPSPTRF